MSEMQDCFLGYGEKVKEVPVANNGHWVFAKVDDEEYDRISKHEWRTNNCGYALRYARFSPIKMHHDVVGLLTRGSIVHHINGDKLDNRRVNLLVVPNHYHKALHKRMKKFSVKATKPPA